MSLKPPVDPTTAIINRGILDVGSQFGGDIAAAYNALPQVGGRKSGTLSLQPGATYTLSSTLVLDDAGGVVIEGIGGTPGYPRLIWTGGAGTGPMIRINSGYGVQIRNVLLGYTNVAFNGNLISTDQSAALVDTQNLLIEGCWLGGLSGATGAASLVKLNKTITSIIRNSHFQSAAVGILKGASYVTTLTISDNAFAQLTSSAIKNPGNTWRIENNAFEPTPAGAACGIDHDLTYWTEAVQILGNWFGDVTSGGGTWVKLRATGGLIAGNYMTTPGPTAGSTHFLLESCFALPFLGNTMVDGTNGIKITAAFFTSDGIVALGNQITSTNPITGQSNTSGLIELGNILTGTPTSQLKGRPVDITSGGLGMLSSRTAGSTANNTVFLDSADSKLKFKDGSGTTQALY